MLLKLTEVINCDKQGRPFFNVLKREDIDVYINDYKEFYNNNFNIINAIDDIATYFAIYDDKLLINVTYNGLTPKSSRYIFRDKIKKIDDIPQRDTKVFKSEGKTHISIVYELKKDEFITFLKYLKELFETLGANPSPDKIQFIFDNNKKLYESVFMKVKNIKSINQPKTSFSEDQQSFIVQFYNIGNIDYIRTELLEEYGIKILDVEIIDSNALLFNLKKDKIIQINQKFSWLIMEIYNPSSFSCDDLTNININKELNIFSNGNEPIVGVIDTGFNMNSSISSFIIGGKVEDCREYKKFRDISHGTQVSSLIIANDEINPNNSDGLGHFRVKHFEVLEPFNEIDGPEVNWWHLYKTIKNIVSTNSNIKVWNLSLGGPRSDPFIISPHGLLLDKLSKLHDVIFIIASGNDGEKGENTLGSPGDSINNITVGSVIGIESGKKVTKAPYSSTGIVLQSLKPDVSHFGGDTLKDGSKAFVYDGVNFFEAEGTSFSTPKVSRYAATLAHKGYNAQEIKAKIISIAEKEKPSKVSSRFGVIYSDRSLYEIKQTIQIKAKKELIIPIKIPKNVQDVVLGYTYSTIPKSKLGHESSIYNIDIELCEYDTVIVPKGNKLHLKVKGIAKNKESENKKYFIEEKLRSLGGKYSTSKKEIFNWSKSKEILNDKKTGLHIKRLDLHDVDEKWAEIIDVSIVMYFLGNNMNAEDFIKMNKVEVITEVEEMVEVPVHWNKK